MRQFSVSLTPSSSVSGSHTADSSRREPDQHPKCDLASSSSLKTSRSHSNHPLLSSITHSNPSPLVISTNLPSSDSLPSSPDSLASPPNPPSPVTPYSQTWLSPENKKSLPWDVEDHDHSRRVSSSTSSYDENSPIENLLAPGDLVCHGGYLQSEPIEIVTVPGCSQEDVDQQLGEEFEVVRRLGAGSYAVVHLVREVLSRPQSDMDHSSSMMGDMDLDSSFESAAPSPVYGREYAIKCLSKANLEDSDLAAQMIEATIHQSLPPHSNIVTLHRTFETPSFLLLLLEYVPGEDLYYFLSRARDRYEMDPVESSVFNSCTPPTPGLLSTINPTQLLSTSRLRLISSMFSQICDAVEFCHSNGVYHRDIKPENLIVTDRWVAGRNGDRERKVVVKLSDFGLACTENESSDMDCGSAPYMSYECRNNLSPKYRPRGADIWSLGIVLLNMLYHRNPWTDAAEGACSSFTLFRHRPVAFLMQRFTGMKRPVAEFLANRVFCILQDPMDDTSRVSAKEFGLWVKELPRLLLPSGSSQSRRMPRAPAALEEHPLGVSMPPSHRPSSRNSSYSSIKTRTPVLRISALHEFSLQPTLEQSMDDLSCFYDPELDGDERPEFDSTCQKVASAALPAQTRISALTSSLRSDKSSVLSCPTPPSPTSATTPTVSKKSSIWRLGFGKSSTGPTERLSPASATPAAPVTTPVSADTVGMSATASNVTSLIMGLSPTDQAPPAKPTTFSKGRQPKGSSFQTNKKNAREQGQDSIMSPRYWSGAKTSKAPHAPPPPPPLQPQLTDAVTSSGASITSGNWRSSMSSTSSLATSNSAFTRFSNNSSRSVATAATSVSASSWRSGPKPASNFSPSQQKTITPATLPRNVKFMTGVPYELGELPRSLQGPTSDPTRKEMIYGSPPLKQRRGMAKAHQSTTQLDTITERPRALNFHSTDDAPKVEVTKPSDTEEQHEETNVHKKVQKGQINTLAKMLSALRR